MDAEKPGAKKKCSLREIPMGRAQAEVYFANLDKMSKGDKYPSEKMGGSYTNDEQCCNNLKENKKHLLS